MESLEIWNLCYSKYISLVIQLSHVIFDKLAIVGVSFHLFAEWMHLTGVVR
jgi:hypothetical protein